MALPGRAPRPAVELKLPPIDQRRVLGGRVVQRAATIMLLVFTGALSIALIVGSLVSIRVTVDGTGILEPVRVVPVRPSQDGLVRHVLVNTGDTVKAGQLLLVLDSLDLLTTLSTLEAQQRGQLVTREQLVSAEPMDRQRQLAQRSQADAHVVRALATLRDRMVTSGLGDNVDSLVRHYVTGSHIALDLAISEVRAAEAEQRIADADAKRLESTGLAVKAQDARLSELQANIAATRARLQRIAIRAPATGIVLTEQVEGLTGAYVRLGEQILEVGDPASWRAVILVNEADMHEVRRGDSVSVDVPALRDLKVPRLFGVVTAVGATPSSLGSTEARTASPTTGAYRVTVSLDPKQLHAIGVDRFRRGFSVAGKVVTKRGVILRLLFDKTATEIRRQTAGLR
jgi:multidrug resistance efflux pump